jgi:hypothetical protein
MADRWTAPDGWVVDVIRLSLTGTGRDGTWLRIRRRGFWVADVRTVAELAAFVPLASLEPDGLAPWKPTGGRGAARHPVSAGVAPELLTSMYGRNGCVLIPQTLVLSAMRIPPALGGPLPMPSPRRRPSCYASLPSRWVSAEPAENA